MIRPMIFYSTIVSMVLMLACSPADEDSSSDDMGGTDITSDDATSAMNAEYDGFDGTPRFDDVGLSLEADAASNETEVDLGPEPELDGTLPEEMGTAADYGAGGDAGADGDAGPGGDAGMADPAAPPCEPDDCGPRPQVPVCDGGTIECAAGPAGACLWIIDNPDGDNDGMCDAQDSHCNLDGDMLRCRRRAPECPEGTVPAVENGCYTNECVSWEACGGHGDDDHVPGAFCGSRGMPPCPRGQFCNFPLNANCGRTDIPGRCANLPQQCNQLRDPVCGCDGVNYGNPCLANRAGMSIQNPGMCEEQGGCDEDQFEVEDRCYDSCRSDRDCEAGLTCNAGDVCLGVPNGNEGGVGAAVCYGWCDQHR